MQARGSCTGGRGYAIVAIYSRTHWLLLPTGMESLQTSRQGSGWAELAYPQLRTTIYSQPTSLHFDYFCAYSSDGSFGILFIYTCHLAYSPGAHSMLSVTIAIYVPISHLYQIHLLFRCLFCTLFS